MPLVRDREFAPFGVCADPQCPHGASARLTGGAGGVAACLNHTMLLDERLDDGAALSGMPGACVACGAPRPTTYVLEVPSYRGTLCRGHARLFLLHALPPDAFHRVVADAGGDAERVHHLHSDFYDPETGEASQPSPPESPRTRAAIEALRAVPPFNEEGNYDPDPALIALMRADVCEATDLEIDDGFAHQLVSELLLWEGMRRDGALPTFPREAAREAARVRLLEILRHADPQGVAHLGLEAEPYAREAGHLARCVHGFPDETPQKLLGRVLACFNSLGWHGDPVGPDALGRYCYIAERIAADVCPGLAADVARQRAGDPPDA